MKNKSAGVRDDPPGKQPGGRLRSDGQKRSILDNLLKGCQIIGFDWRYLYVNEAAARHGRRTREELIGHTMLEIYPGIEDTEMFGYLRRCMESRAPHRMENLFTYADGSQRWFALSIEPVPAGIFILSLDITEPKKAETNLEHAARTWQTTFDSISDWVSIHDMDFKIVRMNRALAQALKMEPEQIIGKHCYEVLHGENGPIPYCPLSEGSKTQKPSQREFFNPHLGIHMEVICSPIFNDTGEITGTVHVARDITERKRAEDRLRQLNEELQMFAYTAAHDLKAPLVTIRGFAGMLQADLMNNRQEKMLEDIRLIEAGVDKMQRLLKGILDYRRISRTVQPAESVPFEEIVEETLQQVAWQVGTSRASVSMAADFPAVHVDRTAMVHAVTNLVQNSTEYRSKERPLNIEIGHRLSDGEFVYIIRDNGIGIGQSQLEKVFTPFYRGTRESQGSGLGLVIVRRIIEGHGGRVWIESEAGKGTTVCFTLGNDKKSGKE